MYNKARIKKPVNNRVSNEKFKKMVICYLTKNTFGNLFLFLTVLYLDFVSDSNFKRNRRKVKKRQTRVRGSRSICPLFTKNPRSR